ncbi:MAG: ATP-binding cassette domain-containing protein [Pseudonocardiales bacterium]
MGYVEVNSASFTLPDGRVLLDEVTFRVGDGRKVALIGANGAGKTTLLRIISGELTADSGAVSRSGGLGVMPQLPDTARWLPRGRRTPVLPEAWAGRDSRHSLGAPLALIRRTDRRTSSRRMRPTAPWRHRVHRPLQRPTQYGDGTVAVPGRRARPTSAASRAR